MPIQTGSSYKKTEGDNGAAQYLERERRATLRRIPLHRLLTLLAPGRNSQRECEETNLVVYIVKRYRILIVEKGPPIDGKRIGPEEIDTALV